MKNIIVCGLIGTGKTTICQKISKKLNMKYIDLYSIVDSKEISQDKFQMSKMLKVKIDNYLETLDNCVIDCDYLILPKDFNEYRVNKNFNIIYLGFNDVNINLLLNKFIMDYESKNIKYDKEKLFEKLKYYKSVSNKVYKDCKKYNYKFFDINRNKQEVIDEVLNYILNLFWFCVCITKNH